MRTDPAYAQLAYRRAVVKYLHNHVLTVLVGADGLPPQDQIISEDVFREDSEVPQEVLMSYAEELQVEEAELDLELKKYQLVRSGNGRTKPQGTTGQEISPAAVRQTRRKGRRKGKG